MTDSTDDFRLYSCRDDGANPAPGQVSWSTPFASAFEFSDKDADGIDASAILADLAPGDYLGFGNSGATFTVSSAAVPVQNRYQVEVEAHDPPASTATDYIVFRRFPAIEPEPEPLPPRRIPRRPWTVEVLIR